MSVSLIALAALAAAQPVTTFYATPLTTPTARVAPIATISALPTTNAILRVGTQVPLRLSQTLTTGGKKLRVGDRFNLETSEPIMV